MFQAEDGIRDLVRSRGLGDVYKRQTGVFASGVPFMFLGASWAIPPGPPKGGRRLPDNCCLLYTSDAADERSSVDLGGRRIIKKKKTRKQRCIGWVTYIIQSCDV